MKDREGVTKNSKSFINDIEEACQRGGFACLRPTQRLEMSGASIGCSGEMRDWVNSYKVHHGLATADQALRHMRAALEGRKEALPAAAAAVEPGGGPVGGKKKSTLVQLICWEDFEEHDEILTYMMGIGRTEREWLLSKLQKKVWCLFFFHLQRALCCRSVFECF